MVWLWSAWSLPSSRSTSWISHAWGHWNHCSPWFTKESEMSFSTISNTLTFQWRYTNVLCSNMPSYQRCIVKSVLTLSLEEGGCPCAGPIGRSKAGPCQLPLEGHLRKLVTLGHVQNMKLQNDNATTVNLNSVLISLTSALFSLNSTQVSLNRTLVSLNSTQVSLK